MTDWIADDLRLVRANNPGPLTGTGTNTWLVGRKNVAVIDPGPADSAHLAAILAALAPTERISHIFVTHNHLDHTALVSALVAATGAVTAGFGKATDGRSTMMQKLAAQGLASGGEGLDLVFQPDICLHDNAVVAEHGWQLQALHTPGHAATHLCFAWGKRLFTGDHVMGWSSSLVSPPDGDMTDYMAGLERLSKGEWQIACPGHGPVITDPIGRMTALLAHRRQREAALLAAIAHGPLALQALTAVVYHDVPVALHPAARRNVLAHVIDLQGRNLISCHDLCASDPIIAQPQSFPV
jgi:glyoxylase-like metal-dependent hydrolase (beta-lactamase superfamily II)